MTFLKDRCRRYLNLIASPTRSGLDLTSQSRRCILHHLLLSNRYLQIVHLLFHLRHHRHLTYHLPFPVLANANTSSLRSGRRMLSLNPSSNRYFAFLSLVRQLITTLTATQPLHRNTHVDSLLPHGHLSFGPKQPQHSRMAGSSSIKCPYRGRQRWL